MRIAVISAGNIGTALACEIAKNINDVVFLLTRNSGIWGRNINVYDVDGKLQYVSQNVEVTENIENIKNFDIYFFTTPKNAIEEVLCSVVKIAKKESIFVYVPGTGGVEFLHNKYCKHIKMIGMQRSPYIARLIKRGESVALLSKKESLFVASTNYNCFDMLAKLLDIKIEQIDNYLAVTFTPSNPILHTTRLYNIFSNNNIEHVYDNNPLFYKDWNEDTSKLLLACDEELQNICHSITNMDLSQVVPLGVYYESANAEEFTNKIRSIPSFAKVTAPMITTGRGYVVDKESRYFLEDFHYGLAYIKAFGIITQVETLNIDKIVTWFNDEFMKNGIKIENIALEKINEAGIFSVDDIRNFYKN